MEDYSLIANSGIQLLVENIEIGIGSRKKYSFHEWFDTDEVQYNLEFVYKLNNDYNDKYVKMADLESCRFLDDNGELTVSSEDVMANPNIKEVENNEEEGDSIFCFKLNDKNSKLSFFYNQWLPLPYYELDAIGNYKNGPYNWARCKIIPYEEKAQTNDKQKVTVILAFDTRTSYSEDDDESECPNFISDTEKEKFFKLSGKATHLIDFCSGKNEWVRKYLMRLVSGTTDIDAYKDDEYKFSFLATYLMLMDELSHSKGLPRIRLIRDKGARRKDVEMIIDIGNSRTAAILFEEGDFTKVKPLRLQNFLHLLDGSGKLNRSQESFDMHVAFQKVSFGDGMLGGSQQFVWPSIVRLGSEADELTHATTGLIEGDEILSTYSSPKRYLWDKKARREEWRCVRTSNADKNTLPIIEGISKYFKDDGSIDVDGYGAGLHYSRKSLMAFAFMEILSQAQTQINSYEYRLFNGNLSTPRRLSKIILTCPTAMSEVERSSLHGSLKDALFVLNKFNLGMDGNVLDIKIIPDLTIRGDNKPWIYDEATCSQFVYLYGRFTQTYLNNSEEFYDIYGRTLKDADGKERKSIVIGSLDIGAGTSDIMVCRYDMNEDNKQRLKPVPLFWDSFDYAGDDMMKSLIENILIQGRHGILEKELSKRNGDDEKKVRRILSHFFGGDTANMSFIDRTLRRDFNLQVLVPVMNRFLDLLSKDEKYRELDYNEIFDRNEPNEEVRNQFKEIFGFGLDEVKWIYDALIMSGYIEQSMNDLLENVATIMYSQGCDLVLLSGRPTSLRPISNIFMKYYNGAADRLIVMNRFRIGRWYPFADDFGYLTDSKSIVPVGAMIGYLASNAGGLNGFSLDLEELGNKLKPTTDYFVLKNTQIRREDCFITPEKDEGEIVLNSLPAYICAKHLNLSFYPARPFYVLDIDENAILRKIKDKHKDVELDRGQQSQKLRDYKESLLEKIPFKFTLERKDEEEEKENLQIAAVESKSGDVAKGDFMLTVQSLNDPECYWLDSGAFNINIRAI